MNTIRNYRDPAVRAASFGEAGATLLYETDYLQVTDRKEIYASFAVDLLPLLGQADIYESSVSLRLKQGAKPIRITAYHKTVGEADGKTFNGYTPGSGALINDREWTTLTVTTYVPDGITVKHQIAYFIQQGRDVFPDVLVNGFTASVRAAEPRPVPALLSRREPTLTVGAIRWDAYFETDGRPELAVSRQVARALSPAAYHGNAPYFSRVNPDGTLSFPLPTQEQFDEELLLAKNAGIDYFAYCWYRSADPMSYARKQHLSSRCADDMKMCAILHVTNLPPEDVRDLAETMKKPCYLRFENRPVVFVWGAHQIGPELFDELKADAKEAGIQEDLYFVAMPSGASVQPFLFSRLRQNGCAAVSDYGCLGVKPDETYQELAERNKTANLAFAAYHDRIDVIPFVCVGKDSRPRIDHPVSWPTNYAGRYAFAPAKEEIRDFLEDLLSEMQARPDFYQPNSVLLYAWNEHDEGGWCCPTLAVDADGWPLLDEAGRPKRNTDILDGICEAIRKYKK